jgi:hypothetical protein
LLRSVCIRMSEPRVSAFRVLCVTVAVIGVLSLLMPALQAQTTSRLWGRVSDFCGAALPGVRVEVSRDGSAMVAFTDRDGRFEVRNLPTGTYSVAAELPGFASMTRRSVVVADRTDALEFTLELAPYEPDLVVVQDPRFAYGVAEAVVHLRIIETLPVTMLNGLPTAEHRAVIREVVKPYTGNTRRPEWGTPPPPIDRIVRDGSLTVLQRNTGTARHETEVITGTGTPARVGEEYVAFLDGRCSRRWTLGLIFSVRGGRVYVPKGQRQYSTEWDRYDGLRVSAFLNDLKALGRQR